MKNILKDYKCPKCKGWNDVKELGDNKIKCLACDHIGTESEFTSKKYEVYLKIKLNWIGADEEEVRNEVPEWYNAFDIDDYEPVIIEVKEVI